jgi:dTDP-4-dehydrorhamnose 3,5-epimerase
MIRNMFSEVKELFEFVPQIMFDTRGDFIKTYHTDYFDEAGLNFEIAEQYFSISKINVIRGMHFQLPPHAHSKMIFCLSGIILDVLLDLRVGSPTYGKYECFELTAKKHNILYIPIGLAHGFCALTEGALMVYNVSTTYHNEFDTGVRWDSFGYDWEIDNPVISARDLSFQPFEKLESPFKYEEK